MIYDWDGSSWTENGDLNQARDTATFQGLGTASAGFLAGGTSSRTPGVEGLTEEWTLGQNVEIITD